MKIFDLTHTVTDQMPVYPGDPEVSLVQSGTIEHEGYVDHTLKTGMHVGTHMDAPAHFIEGGKRLDEVPPENFLGEGKIVDARGKGELDATTLDGIDISEGDIVFIYTGHDATFGTPEYYESYPQMSEALASRLVDLGVKMVGLDTPSPDVTPFAVHKILLGNNVLIIENLTGLQQLLKHPRFDVVALPAKLRAEGAPTRVIAIVE